MALFKDAWNWIANRPDYIIAVISLLVTVILGILSVNENTLPPIAALIVVVAVYAFFVICVLTYREYVLSRKARYAEASIKLTTCHTEIKKAHIAILEKNKNLAKKCLQSCISNFANAAGLITGVSCNACIKSSRYDPDRADFFTLTFCRSTEGHRYSNEDWQPVIKNTDFKELINNPNNQYWSCNDLPGRVNYMNSSPDWPNITDHDDYKKYMKDRAFPYASTIVWPISSYVNNEDGKEELHLCGFLCLDSMTRGAFDFRFETKIGYAIAEELFAVLYLYINSLSSDYSSGTSRFLRTV